MTIGFITIYNWHQLATWDINHSIYMHLHVLTCINHSIYRHLQLHGIHECEFTESNLTSEIRLIPAFFHHRHHPMFFARTSRRSPRPRRVVRGDGDDGGPWKSPWKSGGFSYGFIGMIMGESWDHIVGYCWIYDIPNLVMTYSLLLNLAIWSGFSE